MSSAMFALFRSGNKTSIKFSKEFANLPDFHKLQTLNAAVELLMEKTSSVIISLEVQKENALGDHPRAQ